MHFESSALGSPLASKQRAGQPCCATLITIMEVVFVAGMYYVVARALIGASTDKAERRRSCPVSAVLVLGGDSEREQLAAELCAGLHLRGFSRSRNEKLLRQAADALEACRQSSALTDPSVTVYVSSPATDVAAACRAAGGRAEVRTDTAATDTVSNFTTLAPLFLGREDEHILVLTSSSHEERAIRVGSVVLMAGCGIAVTVAGLPSSTPAQPEGSLRCWRDEARAWLWVVTGAPLQSCV